MTWPEHYPTFCPPADSEEASGDIFRYVEDPPSPKDLKSHWFLYKNNRVAWEKKGKTCEACGISVFRSLEDLEEAGDLCPRLKTGKVAAVASLSGEMGKLKHTRSQTYPKHHTWWIPVAVKNPHGYFSVVA